MVADSIAWLGHSRVTIRSVNEPAIVQLVAAAGNLLKLEGVRVLCERSTPYDPLSNGAAESAVRTTQLGLERELRPHISVGHPIVACMVRHAAMLQNIFVSGDDGKTPWQRARGAPCKLKLVQFGEIARYKCFSNEGGIGGSGDNGALESGSASGPGLDSTSYLIPSRG